MPIALSNGKYFEDEFQMHLDRVGPSVNHLKAVEKEFEDNLSLAKPEDEIPLSSEEADGYDYLPVADRPSIADIGRQTYQESLQPLMDYSDPRLAETDSLTRQGYMTY